MEKNREKILQTMHGRRVYSDHELSHDIFAGREKEMEEYFSQEAGRFYLTLKVAKKILSNASGHHVLEIGANPYFLTAALLHNLEPKIDCLGRPPTIWPGTPYKNKNGFQRRYIKVYQKTYSIEEFTCNAEKDRFPFSSSSFDLVIAAEIIEHLIFSPTHFLYEIHRVLKDGGHLILTTPNALKLLYLYKWIVGQSVWDQYSGYGVYGRHQREYTSDEIVALLESLNFRLVTVQNHSWRRRKSLRGYLTSALYMLLPRVRPQLFVVARAEGCEKVSYPSFLYRSIYPDLWDNSEVVNLNQDHVQNSV